MAEKAGRAMSLADAYRRFGETDVRGASTLYEAVAIAIADSPEALRVVEQAPPLKRHPTVIIAALHDQVLLGEAPELAAAYAARDASAAGPLAVAALIHRADAVVATATRRQTQTNETGRCAVLYPAIARAAAACEAETVGLIDVGCSAGLNLSVDRAAIDYGAGVVLGDPASPLQLACEVVGEGSVPELPIPTVAARVGIDLSPVDVDKDEDARWLHACLWPDQPERAARLSAAIQLSRGDPPTLLAGDALDRLPEAFALVPDGVLPIVTTTWALAYFALEDRLRFLRRLDEAAAVRPIAWVSAEGVGIAPSVPTHGDSRLSAHSLVGLFTAHRGRIAVETVARCHPHGTWLEWLA